MSFPVCDRCKTDHNPFVSCADLLAQPGKLQEKVDAAFKALEQQITTAIKKPDRKAYMRAYMAKQRAKA